jgi:hypothetical protein
MTKRNKSTKATPALPHVTPDGITPEAAGLAGLAIDPPSETAETQSEESTESPEQVAEQAMAQALVTIEPPAIPSLWLPSAGSFSPAIVSKRMHDAESIIGRMRVAVDGNLTKLSGTAGKGGVFWEGHTIRPAQSEKEKAAFALAKAGRAFAKALKEFGSVE